MPHTALILVLASAGLHAGWNTLLAGARNSRSATNIALVVGSLAILPPAIATWEVEAAAVPYIAASAFLELLYVLLLGAAYDHADLSLVYPIARGSSPVLVLGGAFLLGSQPGPVGALGAVLVGAGVIGLSGIGRRGLAYGLGIGILLATITTLDSFGLHHAAPFPYLLLVVAPAALVILARELGRDRGATMRRDVSGRIVLAGFGFVGTYSLILAALETASAASVAAVREVSIVAAVVLAALVLGEPVTRRRVVAAVVVSAGAALAATGA